MKRQTFLIALVLVLATILVVPAGSAFAQTVVYSGYLDIIVEDGDVKEGPVEITGGELVVESGGEIDGDVTVFGGNATIAGNIDGDMVVFGGSVILSGEVDGDLVTFGGNLDVTSAGHVDGDCVVLGGNVTDNSDGTSCASFVEDLPFWELPFLNGMPVKGVHDRLNSFPSHSIRFGIQTDIFGIRNLLNTNNYIHRIFN